MSDPSSRESLVTIVNPEEDDLAVESEFYDDTLAGVNGVSMPAPPASDAR